MKRQKVKVVSIIIMFIAAAVVSFFSYTCAAAGDSLGSGLVLHLSFDAIDDISGQKLVVDESGYENHGVLLGGEIAEGKIGNALKCSAINKGDGVRIKDNDSLDLDAVTMAAWIKTEQIDGQWNRIIDKGWRTAYNLCIGGDYKGKSWYREHAQLECASCTMTSKTPVVDNEWHFIAGTFDGQNLKIYVDGKLDIEKKWKKKVPMKHTDDDIMIGILAVPELHPHEHAFFDGMIDEVRLYNRILLDEEILKLYNMSVQQ